MSEISVQLEGGRSAQVPAGATVAEALKAADPDDLATLNALHYRLGRVAEAQGNLDVAEEHYNEVAANDYGYLDVALRLRNLGT